jgi:beta-glucanase (GH16 family)
VGLEGDNVPASPSNFKEEREELEQVISHPKISRSTSLVKFLSFICNKYFDGESNEIREHTIAVEALGRKESNFDSQADPIVRVTARALRNKLREFYDNEGESHPLQIVLPLGHYIPQFVRREDRVEEVETPAGSAFIHTDSTESAHPRESLITSAWKRDVHGEESQAAAAAWFTWTKWRTMWKPGLIVLSLSAVFLAGFFFGRRVDEHSPVISDSFKWGDPVWSDEFDGPAQHSPDASKWTFDTGNQEGWGNQEVETYCSPASGNMKNCDPHRPNAFLDGSGHLVLRAQKNPDGAWTSARITTRGLKNFQYGRIEARMKLPVGAGLWPAFWMLGENFDKVGWPSSGSVDIVENVSVTSAGNGLGPYMIRSTVHGPRYSKGNGFWHDFKLPNGARVDDASFHTYGVIWSPGMIQFYVDDPANIFFIEDASDVPEGGEWVFDHPFYILMNLAVGGIWPGDPDATTPNPADVLVDYVRVYKIPTVPAPSIQWEPVQVKAGASVASSISLRARSNSGHVYLACSTEPATARCTLATSVVDFTNTLSQEDILIISTDSFTNSGRMVASPGRYKLTITATTISGDRSQLTIPFEVKNGD